MYSKFMRVVGLRTFIRSFLILPFYYLYRKFVFMPQVRKDAQMCGMELDAYCMHRFSPKEVEQ